MLVSTEAYQWTFQNSKIWWFCLTFSCYGWSNTSCEPCSRVLTCTNVICLTEGDLFSLRLKMTSVKPHKSRFHNYSILICFAFYYRYCLRLLHLPWKEPSSLALVTPWGIWPQNLTEMCSCRTSMWWRVCFYPGMDRGRIHVQDAACADCYFVYVDVKVVWSSQILKYCISFGSSALRCFP